jgi:anti-anti-sigma factor
MNLTLRPLSETTVILDIQGNIVPDDLFNEVNRLLCTQKPDKIGVNLKQVGFADSLILGGLLKCHQRCEEVNAQLVLLAPQPAVSHLLALTKLDNLIAIQQEESDLLN